MLSVPSVAIIGGTLPAVMTTPLKLPRIPPRSMPSRTAMAGVTEGKATTVNETIIATSPIIELTDRSMPRVIITIVCPRATMVRIDMLSKMLRKLFPVRNAGVLMPTMAMSKTMKMMMLSSRNLTRVRSRLRDCVGRSAVAFTMQAPPAV